MRTLGASKSMRLYVASQQRLRSRHAVVRHLLGHPLMYSRFDDAIEATILMGPSEETPEERDRYFARLLGEEYEAEPNGSPEHIGYVTEIWFRDLRIGATDKLDKVDQLLEPEGDDPPPDALWLPSDLDDDPNPQFRTIATKKRLRWWRFKIVNSTTVPSRYRPLR